MTRPTLSIITVCFNAAATLRETLASVTNRPTGVEYIVIDGGSTDGTIDILKQHAQSIDLLVSERDHGIFDAMNKGFALATGEFVAYLNADDSYLPGALPAVLQKLEQPGATDVLYADWLGIDLLGREHRRTGNHDFKGHYQLCHQAVVARRSIFPAAPFDLRYRLCADFDLLLRWQQEGRRFEHLPLPLVRFSETGASAKFLRRSARESIAVALRRARFPWAQLFSVRIALYVARVSLLSLLRRQSESSVRRGS